MSEVALENVTKRYGNTLAVAQLQLEVRDREFVVLVGPSGCGKSTTLRLIAGLEEPDEGVVRIGQRVMNHVSPKRRNVTMVFQNPALYPHMSVHGNMAFGLKMRHLPRNEIEQRVHAAAEILAIQDLLDRKPGELSGGQQQRVALGRAIVHEPAVFLFDEPLSNLDANLRIHMRGELVELHHRLQTTMLYVTHDQVEAMTMGHRIAVMEAGRIHQIGSPQEVYHRPANRFVARFIGSPPMNFFDARVHAGQSGLRLQFGAQEITLGTSLERSLGSYAGRHVAVGIRPEEIEIANTASDTNNTLSLAGQVSAVLHLGPETVIQTLCEPTEFRLSVRLGPRHEATRGDRIHLRVALEKLHFFDAQSGKRIE